MPFGTSGLASVAHANLLHWKDKWDKTVSKFRPAFALAERHKYTYSKMNKHTLFGGEAPVRPSQGRRHVLVRINLHTSLNRLTKATIIH